jgi:hypothetical protein
LKTDHLDKEWNPNQPRPPAGTHEQPANNFEARDEGGGETQQRHSEFCEAPNSLACADEFQDAFPEENATCPQPQGDRGFRALSGWIREPIEYVFHVCLLDILFGLHRFEVASG